MRKIGIFSRFAIIAIGLCIIPMLIIVIGMYSFTIKTFDNVMDENYLQLVSSIQDRLDSAFGNYNDFTKLPYYFEYYSNGVGTSYLPSDMFRQIAQGEHELAKTEEARSRVLLEFLNHIRWSDSHIRSAFLIADSPDGLAYYESSYPATMLHGDADDGCLSLMDSIDMKSNKLMLIEDEYGFGDSGKTFTIARNAFDTRGYTSFPSYVGTLFLNIDFDLITNIVDSINWTRDESVMILYGDYCIYSNREELKGKHIRPEDVAVAGDTIYVDSSHSFDISSYIIVPRDTGYLSMTFFTKMAVFFLLSSLVLFAIFMFLLMKHLSRPMHNLMNEMHKLEKGDFNIDIDVNSKDEIGELAACFNDMSAALNAYIDKVYVAQLRQTEAELTSLKSQIYPHFLYNTLEVIRMSALDSSDEKVADMIESLASQIRYVIGSFDDTVPVSAEIDIVRKYVYLLNCRIETHISLDIDDRCPELNIPKLILQPIVENAYIHGIKPMGRSGAIAITIMRKGSYAFISIMNNGKGMSQEELERTVARMKSDEIGIRNEYNWQSIGMKNVYDRLHLLYGDDCDFSIESHVEIGTIVTMRIPYRKYDRGDDDKYSDC